MLTNWQSAPFLTFNQFEAQERQVIVGCGTVAVAFDSFLQHLDNLLGVERQGARHQFLQAMLTEELLLRVLGFVEAIGVDEHLASTDVVDALAYESTLLPDADGTVGVLKFHELAIDKGCIMPAVAVVEVTRLEVGTTDEHGDKHILLVVVREDEVNLGGNLLGRATLLGHDAEEITRDSHEEGCGDTLATNVADAEIEALVLDKEVVEVATHLLGGGHRGIEVDIRAVGECREDAGHHRHLYVARHLELALNRCLLGGGLFQFLDVAGEGALHVAERLAELPDFVYAPALGEGLVEVTLGDNPSLVGEAPQRLQLAGDDLDAHQQQEQQSRQHSYGDGTAQAVESAKDVALGADNGDAPARVAEGLVEDIALLPVDDQLAHALLATLHGVAECGEGGVLVLQGFGEDGVEEELGAVGMHKEGTPLPYHNAVGVGIRLDGRNGVGKPGEGEVDGDGTHILSALVLDRLAVGSYHVLRVDVLGVVVDERFGPHRPVEQFAELVPVHVEVLVVLVTLLRGEYLTVVSEREGREVAPLLLEEIGLEGDGAAVQVGIVLEEAARIDEHRVGTVEVAVDEPVGVVGRHLDTFEDGVDPQRGVLEDFRGVVHRFLSDGLTRHAEHVAQRRHKDHGGEEHYPETEFGG